MPCASHSLGAGAILAANHGMFTRDRQVSIRASAKPGRGGVGLRGCDFKCSKHVYAMISRQSPDVIWLEVLKPSDPAVKAFARRNKLGYPDQRYLDHGDTFDAFLMELDLDRTRKEGGFFQSSVVPKKKEEVGSVYPSLLELEDIHTWVLESTRCRLTLCSVQASPSRHFCEGRVDCQMIAHCNRSHASRLLCIDCPIWARFKASGEQDLDGFDDVDEEHGEEEDEDEDMPDDDDDDGEHEAAATAAAELDAAEHELEGEEGIFVRGPVDAFTGFSQASAAGCTLACLLPACLPITSSVPQSNREPSSWKDTHHHRCHHHRAHWPACCLPACPTSHCHSVRPRLSLSGLELNPGDAPARNLGVDAPRSSTRPAVPVHGLESAEAPVGASGSGDDEEREAAASASAGLAAAPCLGASAAPGTAAASATEPDRAVLSAAASASRQAAAPSHGASAAGTAAASARAVSTPPPLATLEQAKAVKPFDVIDVLFSATQWHTAVVQRVDQVWHHRCCPRCAALAALAAPPLLPSPRRPCLCCSAA